MNVKNFIEMHSKLIEEILNEKEKLIHIIRNIPPSIYYSKQMDGPGGKVSVSDLIAYQIGWGKCLIRWYETGIKGETPDMPGDGFSKWDYKAIAKHFYLKYQYDSLDQQIFIFQEAVNQIIAIIQEEQLTGNIDKMGVWEWCTLSSGKQWPLSKWIRVNTSAPYKRAYQLIKKLIHEPKNRIALDS